MKDLTSGTEQSKSLSSLSIEIMRQPTVSKLHKLESVKRTRVKLA